MPGRFTSFRSPPDLSLWFKRPSSVILYLKATLPQNPTNTPHLPALLSFSPQHPLSMKGAFTCLSLSCFVSPLLEGTCSVSFTSISTSRRHSINTRYDWADAYWLEGWRTTAEEGKGEKPLFCAAIWKFPPLMRRVLVDCEEGIREGSKGHTPALKKLHLRGNTGLSWGEAHQGHGWRPGLLPTGICWISTWCKSQSPSQLKTHTTKVTSRTEAQSLLGLF